MRKLLSTVSKYKFATPLYQRLGWGVLVSLLILAAWFWKERAICMDVAFQTFLLINEGTFQVMVNRFGVVFVQWLPLLAIKLGLNISWILFLYSLSFVFFQLVCYYFTVRIFKNEYLGLVFIFLFIAEVEGAFYWTISEYQQAMALLLVYFAFVLKYIHHQKQVLLLLSIPFIITLVFYHPMLFFMFAFLWAFLWLHDKTIRIPSYYSLLALLAIIWLIKHFLFKNWYDNAKQRYLTDNLENYFPQYWKMDSFYQFWEHGLNTFFFFPILFIGILIYYFKKGDWLKGILIFSSTSIYLFLVNVTHATGAQYFYLESFYFPMTLFVIVPIVFEFANNYSMRKNIQISIAIFFFFRLLMIGNGHQYFNNRLNKIANLVEFCDSSPAQKVRVQESTLGDQVLEMNWAVPFETLFYSIIAKKEEQQSLFIYKQLHERQEQLIQSDTVLLYMDKAYPYTKLNNKYFHFEEEDYLFIESNKKF